MSSSELTISLSSLPYSGILNGPDLPQPLGAGKCLAPEYFDPTGQVPDPCQDILRRAAKVEHNDFQVFADVDDTVSVLIGFAGTIDQHPPREIRRDYIGK